MSFESLGLSAEILRAIAEQGYEIPTPIQQQAIPVVLAKRDLLAAAQTGTGKTAGFTLPLLQRLMTASSPIPSPAQSSAARKVGQPVKRVSESRPIRAVILAPTRELAAQVAENVSLYSQFLPLRCTVVFGGVNINPQITRLRRGVDILIATPGRLLDHIERGTVALNQVEILVLDEADRMLDMGFIHDIRKVLALLPKQRQNLLFSATFSREIKQLAGGFLNNPAIIEVAPEQTSAATIQQRVYPVDRHRKRELLSYLIGSGNWQQVLVFMRTKHGANRLVKQLEEDGLKAAAIHGNKSQGARTRALAGFKDGSMRVLVATDIAARGLDIDQLPHVVNFELPNVPEDYVHRIGRTGRAGRGGEAISLVCVDEHKLMRDIELLLKRKIETTVLPGFEPDPSIEAEPIPNGRNSGGGGGGRRSQGRPPSRGSSHASARHDRPRHEGGVSRQDSSKPKPRLNNKGGASSGVSSAPPGGRGAARRRPSGS